MRTPDTKPLLIHAAAVALLAGCATAPEPETLDESVVVLKFFEELGGVASDPDVSCKAGYRYIYPPEVSAHAREVSIEVVGSPMLSSSGALPLPRPERDPRPTRRDDGLMQLEVTLASFDPCRRQTTGEGPVIEVGLGECVEGDCPPMRFEAPDGAELIRYERTGN
ncbi:MAG: hypothetical protein R3323_04090 [Wenzhouxiangellaceae bacterium]|nr:hypothetical protein [Wenzhouxiangellaceae bacterium]